MPNFQYKAVDRRGKSKQGTLDAENPADLEQRLERMGFDLISSRIRERKPYSFGSARIGRVDLINFCFNMEQLTRSGITLMEGLADLRDSIDHPRFKEVVANLIEELEGGKNLSEAMEAHPAVFDTLFVNLIRAGEASGQLTEVFDSLAKTLKWQDELASQTKKILLFPSFVALVVFGATFFLMVYLVPQLVSFIKEMGQTLPLHTRILIAVSNFCINYWFVILMGPPLLLIVVQVASRASARFRFFLDDMKLKVWMIGPIFKKIILSRFANFFAMLYGAGIPILQCLEISQGVAGNLVVSEALRKAGDDISDGTDIAKSFENTGIFPRLVISMLRVGESTGELDTSLINISYFFDRQVKELIDKLQSMIEPIMTVVLGAILGWVMLSVLGPIYDTISKIGF